MPFTQVNAVQARTFTHSRIGSKLEHETDRCVSSGTYASFSAGQGNIASQFFASVSDGQNLEQDNFWGW
jgi:hypothetical protein